MKGKAMIPLILGLGIGLLAVKLTVDAIRRAQASGQTKSTITAVRAKEDIPAFAEIRPQMVEDVETSDSLFAPAQERIESVEQVIGRVTAKAIPKHAPVLLAMLAPEGTPSGMVGRIPTGFRAVSVKIDEVSGVAFQLQIGDWVDVIVVMDVNTGGRRKETIAEVILQHIEVAAIGRGLQSEADAPSGRSQPAKSATLLVPEQEVPKLHLAGTRGKITLAMRGDDEKTTESGAFANSSDLLASLRGMMPPSLPAVTQQTQSTATLQTLFAEPGAEPDPPHRVMIFRRSSGGRNAVNVERITFANARSSDIIEVSQGNPTRQANTMSAGRSRGASGLVPRPNLGDRSNKDFDQTGTQGSPAGEQ